MVLIRSGPIRFSAHRPSSMAWNGCMAGITPNSAKRGNASGERCWACSMRARRSRSPFSAMVSSYKIQEPIVGPVTDGVDDQLKARRVADLGPLPKGRRVGGEEARRPGLVGIRIVEPGRGGSQRAVDEPLQATPPQEIITPSIHLDEVPKPLPRGERVQPSRPASSAGHRLGPSEMSPGQPSPPCDGFE